jgi:mono/diheme cytochrome c family protein
MTTTKPHMRGPHWIRRPPLAAAAVVAALTWGVLVPLLMLLLTPAARPQTPATRSPAAVLNQYCVTCHNTRLKTAGLVLDPSELPRAGSNPELWEKVDRKLRSYAMPPAGMPRPDDATYQAVASYLETELDRASAAKPNPGKLPPVHRVSRTEYENSVRDLLALDSLPKEMDYSVLLPPDNTSSGFDNIADLLFVSPAVMERYLDAATKISRLAVGDPSQPLMVNIYRVSNEQFQDARVEDLPLGTRGGIAIHSDFPLDGDYNVRVELAGAARDQHQLEISVDGERVKLVAVGGNGAGGRGGRGGRGGGEAAKPPEFRIPMKAGARLIGVTFVQRSEARDEATLRPRMRSTGPLPAIGRVTISGPYDAKGPGDTPSRRRVFVCTPTTAAEEQPCAKQILSTLARRAYRRPVVAADLDRLMPFYTAGRAQGSFDLGIQKSLERLLVSPNFLFRVERDPAGATPGTPYRITNLELASRLSFFLWSSLPDDELLDAAIAGKLNDPTVLEQQVRRMLADPRSESLVTNFAAQWLYLRDLGAKQPDEVLFPDFDETLRAGFERETTLFLASVLRENRSVLDLLTANYTFLNERLARHYGIPNVKGSHFRRVTFPEGSTRGGLLGQGSILTITSYATRTSPVLRGKWVLENLLAAPPPPPPPDVPALKTEAAEPGKTLSMREAMTQHRANPVCAGCHARMDPIGFAMENFDAIGKHRDQDGENPIDASGVLPDGTKFDGMAGLKQALLRHPEQFVNTVAEKLLMYAVGRNLQYYDEPAVRAVVHAAAQQNYSLASLVLGVVKSTPFQMREPAGP